MAAEGPRRGAPHGDLSSGSNKRKRADSSESMPPRRRANPASREGREQGPRSGKQDEMVATREPEVKNDYTCAQCGNGGDLLCCDLCPKAICSVCFGSAFPQGDAKWHCGLLKNGACCSTRRAPQGSKTHAVITDTGAALWQSLVPDELPCRDQEYKTILGIVMDPDPSRVHITGMTGTGKTETMKQVMRTIQREETEIKCVYINAYRFATKTRSNLIYAEIARQIMGIVCTAQHAKMALAALFGAAKEEGSEECSRAGAEQGRAASRTLLVVDEIDTVDTNIWYNLAEWSIQSAKTAHELIFVGISIEEMQSEVQRRIKSRINHTLLFRAYTHDQIIEILTARVQSSFTPDAVGLCALKVATTTGDIRVALDICKRARDICIKAGRRVAGFVDVGDAIKGMVRPPLDDYLPHITLAQKIFIKALILESKRLNTKTVAYDLVVDRYQRLSTLRGHACLRDPSHLLLLRYDLESTGIVEVSPGKIQRNPRMQLLILPDDINRALQADAVWATMSHH